MIAYKLFRILKDGSISSLFINKKERYSIDEWMDAKNYPTKGYSERFGWHCLSVPNAPHLSDKNRQWFEVEIEDFIELDRPQSQGGVWLLSKRLKINKPLNETLK